jgi:hypothetical protein
MEGRWVRDADDDGGDGPARMDEALQLPSLKRLARRRISELEARCRAWDERFSSPKTGWGFGSIERKRGFGLFTLHDANRLWVRERNRRGSFRVSRCKGLWVGERKKIVFLFLSFFLLAGGGGSLKAHRLKRETYEMALGAHLV